MKTIFGIIVFSIVSISLFAGVLVVGFQTGTPGNVISGTFETLQSPSDVMLMIAVPLALVVGFSVMALGFIIAFKETR